MQYKIIGQVALSSVFAVGSLFGVSINVAHDAPSGQVISMETHNATSTTQKAIEKKAIMNPALLEVARCESGLKQFNPDGTVVRGKVNPHDIGILQINSDYHEATAISMGYDIYTEEGNIRYGNHLYETQGLTPWNWSKPCWGN